MFRRFLFVSLFGAILPTSPVLAESVRLSDGDSFRIGELRFRLHGVDAPELHQECKGADGKDWPCGVRARSELRRLIGTHPVECKAVTVDRFGRVVATCTAGGKDLAEEMVRNGFATVYTRPGSPSPYDKVQAEARTEKRGLWAGSFDVPSDWRRAHPRDEDLHDGGPNARDWVARTASYVWQWLQQKIGR